MASGERGTFGALITENRYCTSCQYNLKGLTVGGVCPECGTTIVVFEHRGSRTGDLPLPEAPRLYLNLLTLASVVAGATACVILASSMPFWSAQFGAAEMEAVRVGAAALWFGALLVTMRPRPTSAPEGEREPDPLSLLKIGVIATQVLLLLGAVVGLAGELAGIDRLAGPASGLFWLGMLGWPAVAWHFGTIADWGNDFTLATRLKGASWTLAAGFLIVGAVWAVGWLDSGAGTFLRWIAYAMFGFWVIALLAMIAGIFQTGSMVQWAIKNNNRAIERDRVFAERAQERERKRAEKDPGAPIPGPDPELLRSIEEANRHPHAEPQAPDEDRPQSSPSMHRIRKSGDADPYAIEDD